MNWSLELYQQFNARPPRPGQLADRGFLHHIVAEGTADMDVLHAMENKDPTQEAVNAAVCRRLINSKEL